MSRVQTSDPSAASRQLRMPVAPSAYDVMPPSAMDWLTSTTPPGAATQDWQDGWDACRNYVASKVRAAEAAAPPAQALPGQQTESVLIDGVAYDIPAPVAAEMLRLHLETRAPASHQATVDAMREMVRELAKSPEAARAFLLERGFITEDGKLPAIYGGSPE